jgi:hypothetical protein
MAAVDRLSTHLGDPEGQAVWVERASGLITFVTEEISMITGGFKKTKISSR